MLASLLQSLLVFISFSAQEFYGFSNFLTQLTKTKKSSKITCLKKSIFKIKKLGDGLVNKHHEYFGPSYGRTLETETKLKFKSDQEIHKPSLLVLNFKEIFLFSH